MMEWFLGIVGLFLMLSWLPFALVIRRAYGKGSGIGYAIRQMWASTHEDRTAVVLLAIQRFGIALIGLSILLEALGTTTTSLILAGCIVTFLSGWPFRKLIERLIR
jgi:hypothetical protein